MRSDRRITFESIEVHAMGGDGTAVKANKYHNVDPSSKIKSICIIDGDSRQQESESEGIYRLPGDAPEMQVFDQVLDKIDESSGILSVRFMREFKDSEEIKKIIKEVSMSNRDHHLIFSQIGERVGFIDENIIRDAFLSTWCEKYKEEVKEMISKINHFLPHIK